MASVLEAAAVAEIGDSAESSLDLAGKSRQIKPETSAVTCNVSFYSSDRPTSFFDHLVDLSPWIDPADVQRRGAVILWTHDTPPHYLKKYYEGRAVMLPDIVAERAGVRWYRKLAGPLRTVTVHAAFLPPKEK